MVPAARSLFVVVFPFDWPPAAFVFGSEMDVDVLGFRGSAHVSVGEQHMLPKIDFDDSVLAWLSAAL